MACWFKLHPCCSTVVVSFASGELKVDGGMSV